MKKLPLVFLFLLSVKGRSQEKESFYVFDANWKPAKIQTAYFFLHTHQVNDSCWQWDYYNYMGPLVKTEQYKDKDGNEMNGVCFYYDKKGYTDSMTIYVRGKKNGDSWRWRDNVKARMTYKFLDDSLVEVIDEARTKKDSAVSYKDEKESEYPGGQGAWSRYLSKNLVYPERGLNASVQGQVDVQFIVDKNGNIINSRISKSVEYSLDEEALKIINDSGKWEPAFQNGRNVKSYKRQPINFRLK
jgi:protein TonB